MALHDVKLVVAREQAFASWTKLKVYTQLSPRARHRRIFVADMQWITDRVHRLLRTRQSAGPAAVEQIREWHPLSPAALMKKFVRPVFRSRCSLCTGAWVRCLDDLVLRVNLLASASNAEATEPPLVAFRALESGDVGALESLLRHRPRLAQERGTSGNFSLEPRRGHGCQGEP